MEGAAYPLSSPQPDAPFGATGPGEDQPPAPHAGESEPGPERQPDQAEGQGELEGGSGSGYETGPDGQPREGRRRRRRRGRRGGRNRHRQGETGGFAGPAEPRDTESRPPIAPEQTRPERPRDDGASYGARGDSPARREFRVTTPAEAGIAFLDGPRFGRYEPDAEREEAETPPPRVKPSETPSYDKPPAQETRAPEPPAPTSQPEPPAPTPHVTPSGVPSHDETPEERERRLRARKTEIVEVGKSEGAPAKRGWWRRG